MDPCFQTQKTEKDFGNFSRQNVESLTSSRLSTSSVLSSVRGMFWGRRCRNALFCGEKVVLKCEDVPDWCKCSNMEMLWVLGVEFIGVFMEQSTVNWHKK